MNPLNRKIYDDELNKDRLYHKYGLVNMFLERFHDGSVRFGNRTIDDIANIFYESLVRS